MKKFLIASCMTLILAGGCEKTQAPSVQGHEYLLTGTPKNMSVSLSFSKDDNRFFGKAVNNYFGTYTIEGDTIRFTGLGSTMMAAPESEMRAEMQYFQDLDQARSYQVTPTSLTLRLADDRTLEFRHIR